MVSLVLGLFGICASKYCKHCLSCTKLGKRQQIISITYLKMVQCLKQLSKTIFLTSAITRANSISTNSLQRLHEEQHFWIFTLHPHPLCRGGGAVVVPRSCGSHSTKCRRQHSNRACICCMTKQKCIFLTEIARLISSLLSDMAKKIVLIIQGLLRKSKKNVIS